MTIRVAEIKDIESIIEIYTNCKIDLDNKQIFQWTDNYPNLKIINTEINKGILYVLENNRDSILKKIVGTINVDEEQEKEYQKIKWEFDANKVFVIHRLAIDPAQQGNGFAQKLINFAEKHAKENEYTSIRLDTYSQNKRAINFYKKRGYICRGEVNFLEREYPFICMEKEIENNRKQRVHANSRVNLI